MRLCATFWIAFGLIGCSSTPPLELPTCEIPAAPAVAQRPLALPELPLEVAATETTATYDREGMLQWQRYRIASDTNTTIAQENALALEARNESVNALIECSEFSKHWMEIREEMLAAERRAHFIDNWFHRGLIALGLILVATD